MNATPQEPSLGSIIADRYILLERIGDGRSGITYKAEHAVLRTNIALKLIHKELSENEDSVLRYHEAITKAANIESPHLVSVSDFGRAKDERLFVAMEHLDGVTLATYLQRKGKLSEEEALDILSQTADALEEIHENGLVHGDIRPSNIFIAHKRKKNIVKLLDLGLFVLRQSKDNEQQSTLTKAIADPRYASPEHASNTRVGPQSDIYSLALVGYEMVYGEPPFSGNGTIDILTKHKEARPIALADKLDEISVVYSAAIDRALSKRPERRYKTILRFIGAISGNQPVAETEEERKERLNEQKQTTPKHPLPLNEKSLPKKDFKKNENPPPLKEEEKDSEASLQTDTRKKEHDRVTKENRSEESKKDTIQTTSSTILKENKAKEEKTIKNKSSGGLIPSTTQPGIGVPQNAELKEAIRAHETKPGFSEEKKTATNEKKNEKSVKSEPKEEITELTKKKKKKSKYKTPSRTPRSSAEMSAVSGTINVKDPAAKQKEIATLQMDNSSLKDRISQELNEQALEQSDELHSKDHEIRDDPDDVHGQSGDWFAEGLRAEQALHSGSDAKLPALYGSLDDYDEPPPKRISSTAVIMIVIGAAIVIFGMIFLIMGKKDNSTQNKNNSGKLPQLVKAPIKNDSQNSSNEDKLNKPAQEKPAATSQKTNQNNKKEQHSAEKRSLKELKKTNTPIAITPSPDKANQQKANLQIAKTKEKPQLETKEKSSIVSTPKKEKAKTKSKSSTATSLALARKAKTNLQNGNYEKARSLYTQALALNRQNSLALSGLGELHFELGQYKKAERYMRQALQLRPQNSRYHGMLGNIMYKQGKIEQAVSEYRKALKLNPNNRSAKSSLEAAIRRMAK